MEKANYDISPPAYDDETTLAAATASPQMSFADHREKAVSYLAIHFAENIMTASDIMSIAA